MGGGLIASSRSSAVAVPVSMRCRGSFFFAPAFGRAPPLPGPPIRSRASETKDDAAEQLASDLSDRGPSIAGADATPGTAQLSPLRENGFKKFRGFSKPVFKSRIIA